VKPPGSILVLLSELLFSQKNHTVIFQPIIAELQADYLEALSHDCQRKFGLWKSRLVVLRGWISFWSAAGTLLPLSIARKAWKIIG